jgi:hypothetical protein
MTISGFQNPDNSTYVQWKLGNQLIVKRYPAVVYAVELASHCGALIVEPYDGSTDNAVIYNADGSPRIRLINPLKAQGAICFAYPYYVGAELTVVSALHGLQFGCVFDEDGRLLRTYESR